MALEEPRFDSYRLKGGGMLRKNLAALFVGSWSAAPASWFASSRGVVRTLGASRLLRTTARVLCALIVLESAPALAGEIALRDVPRGWPQLRGQTEALARTADVKLAGAAAFLSSFSPLSSPRLQVGDTPNVPKQPEGFNAGPPSPPGFDNPRPRTGSLVSLKTGASFDVPLRAGWNLISLPRIPGDPSPAALFSALATRVFAYDACDAADPWKLWDSSNPTASDLTSVDPRMGLWVEAPVAATLPVAGAEPFTTTVHLCSGWNLIGTPLSQPRSVAGALASIAGRYSRLFGFDLAKPGDPWAVADVAVPAWASTLKTLAPGAGYWLLATAESDLVVPNTLNGPAVQIAVPLDLSRVTEPSMIVGTASGDLFQGWALSYRALGAATWTPLASGTAPVVNVALASFDPTLLLNGPYQLQLTASDANGLENTTQVDLSVEGQQKIGNFTLTYQDLTVPLAGLPIQILRTYDSRDKRQGDFGIGWTLDVQQGSYQNNRLPGEGWQFAQGFVPCQFIGESLGHRTTIRLSDREIYRFKVRLRSPVPTLGGCFAQASFDFVDGTIPGAQLEILGNTQVLYQNGANVVADSGSLEVYEPHQVRLTTRDGRIFDLDLQRGITRLEDRNGNQLAISVSGITHSGGRTVVVERDAQGRITHITDPEGNGLLYEYDGAGDLVSVADRFAQATHFHYGVTHLLLDLEGARGITPIRNEYDTGGRLLRSIDAAGKVVEYTHDLADHRETVTDRLGHRRLLEYDARGNVIREVDALGKVTRRTFDAQDNPLTDTDPLGHTTTRSYDANQNLLSIVDPLGNRTSYTYNSWGQQLTATDPRGKVTANAYDANGNLLSTTDPLGGRTDYSYDPNGNLLSHTDQEGAVTHYEYDLDGNRIRVINALDIETTYTFDRNGQERTRTTSRTTPAGSETLTWRTSYDALGRVVESTDPDGTSVQTVYNPLDQVLESVDKLGRRSRNTYDDLGLLVRTTYADGTSESNTYDAENRRLTRTDRGGRVSRMEYDALGRMLRTTYADGTYFTQSYDDAGRQVAVTDARGNSTTFVYDVASRRTKVRDALGNETSFAFDSVGSQTGVTDAKGQATTYEFDDLLRPIRTHHPDGTTEEATYDRAGRRKSETDAAGAATLFGYDALGRLITVTDALNQVTRYAYDEQGRRTGQTDANGHTTTFGYDKLGRQIRRTLPLGASEAKSYDAAGNLLQRTDFNGAAVTHTYDLNNGLLSRSYPDGSMVSFTYASTGARASVTDGRGTTSYTYDSRDQLIQMTLPNGQRLAYEYDAQGNRTKLTAMVAGQSLIATYSYDPLNRLATVTDPNGRAYVQTYDANGNRESLTYPSGVTTRYGYDRQNRLVNLTTKTGVGAVLQSYSYTLGPTGNRTQIIENGGQVLAYQYDPLYRLTQEMVKQGAQRIYANAFDYDQVGNRLSQQRADSSGTVTTTPYTYDERDRLLTEGTSTQSWDVNGNLSAVSSAEGAAYTWDTENRLTRIQNVDGTVVAHTYDADGNRVRTAIALPGSPSITTDYLVDTSSFGVSQVVAETSAASAVTYYVRGDDLLAATRLTGTTYYHADGLGSIRVITEASGNVEGTVSYSATGELHESSGAGLPDYQYAGEWRESRTQLTYLRNRWLTTSQSRFLSTDQLNFDERRGMSLNPYLYAEGDPVNKTDPLGLFVGGITEFQIVAKGQAEVSRITLPAKAALFLSLSCALVGIATTIGAANGVTTTTIPGKDLCGLGVMAVQLQKGTAYSFEKVAVEIPTALRIGVTSLQVRNKAEALYLERREGAPWFPSRLDSNLISSIIMLSEALTRFVKFGGVVQGGNIWRETFKDKKTGEIYRLDLENRQGHNLRW